jgi:uncharacterized protein YbbC (DUF1343 family)
MPLLFALLLLSSACAPAVVTGPAAARPGAEVLLERLPDELVGRRVGLITNQTGVDRTGTSTIDRLHTAPNVRLVGLYSPEHGIRGVAAAGEHVASGLDERTGLPIHSLYGETQRPTSAMLEGVEALIFDMQDIGTRQYTYISTMALGMQAAAERGIPFVVLDRPNPIGGVHVEGNILEPAFASFVGIYPIPVRHGMTAGELARLFNREFGIGANLIVVPAEGWSRGAWFDETGLPWINPSPNIRSLEAAIHYPGTVFFEATNLSEGRGTDLPFHQTGAPWLRAADVVGEMEAMRLPGVSFQAVEVDVEPSAAKFGGQRLQAVRLILTDRESYRPVRTSLLLIDTIRRLHPAEFEFRGPWLERLGGTDSLLPAFQNGRIRDLLDEWDRDAERFRQIREPYLLYR